MKGNWLYESQAFTARFILVIRLLYAPLIDFCSYKLVVILLKFRLKLSLASISPFYSRPLLSLHHLTLLSLFSVPLILSLLWGIASQFSIFFGWLNFAYLDWSVNFGLSSVQGTTRPYRTRVLNNCLTITQSVR